jgi:cell filamentation protein
MKDRYKASGAEARFQPGSDDEVLENLLGITSKVELDQAEYEALIQVQERYASELLTSETRLTAELIRQMHGDWLGHIYAWAGSYRRVNVAKGGFKWPPYGFVEGAMINLESNLLTKYTPCKTTTINEVAAQLAEVHAEFLLIHPFRDGNGRLARWIADIMALQAGWAPPAYAFSGPDAENLKRKYIEAVTLGYELDFEPLTRFFVEALKRGATP